MFGSLWRVLKHAVSAPESQPISVDHRDDAIKGLDERIDTTDAAVARLLFAEVKEDVLRRHAAQRTIEGKAASVVGFASVALAFDTGFRNGALLHSGWALPTIVLLLVAVLVGVTVLFTQPLSFPEAAPYNVYDLINDAHSEARILAALVEGWVESGRKIEASGALRDARLRIAFIAYALGVVLVIISIATNVHESLTPNDRVARRVSAVIRSAEAQPATKRPSR